MALKKADAGHAFVDAEKRCIKAAEDYIDKKLANADIHDLRVVVTFDELHKHFYTERVTSARVIRALRALYIDAGWDVQVVYDQRDGSRLEFS